MQSEMSVLYVLMAVIIFLALMAAIGAWVRGGGLKREDAENLFNESRERHREEIAELHKAVEEARLAAEQAQLNAQQAQTRAAELQSQTAEALNSKLQDIDSHVNQTRAELESAVSKTAADNQQALAGRLDMVTQQLGESEQRMNENVHSLNEAMQGLHDQVGHAGVQMKEALLEIARQQQDQKAQGTIQMCEALITSLGTLKNSIASQLTLNAYEDLPKRMVEAESATAGYEAAEAGVHEQQENLDETTDIAFKDAGESGFSIGSEGSEGSEGSDLSEVITAHGYETENASEQTTETSTANWGDAMAVPADEEQKVNSGQGDGSDFGTLTTDEGDDDNRDNNDRYPPPIY